MYIIDEQMLPDQRSAAGKWLTLVPRLHGGLNDHRHLVSIAGTKPGGDQQLYRELGSPQFSNRNLQEPTIIRRVMQKAYSRVSLLFYAIATVFQLYHGSDIMYEININLHFY